MKRLLGSMHTVDGAPYRKLLALKIVKLSRDEQGYQKFIAVKFCIQQDKLWCPLRAIMLCVG
jgi:hypothetical protein